MEPTNHPFRKENDMNQTSMIMFHVNLPGCSFSPLNNYPNKAGDPSFQFLTSFRVCNFRPECLRSAKHIHGDHNHPLGSIVAVVFGLLTKQPLTITGMERA